MKLAVTEPNIRSKSTAWSLSPFDKSNVVAGSPVIVGEHESIAETYRLKSTALGLLPLNKSKIVAGSPMIADEYDSFAEIYRVLLAQPDPGPVVEALHGPLVRPVGNLLSAILHLNKSTVAILRPQDTGADSLSDAAPDDVQGLFHEAELQLSEGVASTARYALKLLRRIRTLVGDIVPHNISGRVTAFIDGEDDSATIEWIRNTSRLGFVLDQERESSSWFVVMPDGSSKSGYLYGKNPGSLRSLLQGFLSVED